MRFRSFALASFRRSGFLGLGRLALDALWRSYWLMELTIAPLLADTLTIKIFQRRVANVFLWPRCICWRNFPGWRQFPGWRGRGRTHTRFCRRQLGICCPSAPSLWHHPGFRLSFPILLTFPPSHTGISRAPSTFVAFVRQLAILAIDPMICLDDVKFLWVFCWIPRKLV